MLSMLWWFPLAVAAVGVVPLWLGTRRLIADTGELRVSIDELARLRPVIAEVRAEIAAIGTTPAGRTVRDLGPR